MHTINIRNKFDLHWKKITVISLLTGLLFTLFAIPTFAQKEKSTTLRLLDYDRKDLHYGFQIGLFSSGMNLRHSRHFLEDPEISDSTMSISPNRNYSFSLGFIVNKSLADELWDIRLLPNVAFYVRSIDFFYPNSMTTQTIENANTFIELPVLLKYKSVRRKNMRVYLVGGLTGGIGVSGRRGAENPNRMNFRDYNLEVSYGVGLDGYMQLFNFAPEIRFSHGLINMLRPDSNVYSNNIDRITTHKVALYFNFEG